MYMIKSNFYIDTCHPGNITNYISEKFCLQVQALIFPPIRFDF